MVLTRNEQKILTYIQKYCEKKGYPPSNIEIHKNFGFKSKNSVRQYLTALNEKGAIAWSEGSYQKRNISLPSKQFDSKLAQTSIGAQEVQLEGEVAAGYLTEAIENPETIIVPQQALKKGFKHFALRVRGDSMQGDHILDGDIIIIRKTSDFHNGQIVVVDVDGESTLKRIHWDGKKVELRASNAHYPTQYIEDRNGFKVLGTLCYVQRTVD